MLLAHPDIDINMRDLNSRTALHMACWGRLGGREGKLVNNEILDEFPDGLRMILEKNPKYDIVDRDGNNAMHISCSTNALECIKIWQQRGVDFNVGNAFDENGFTVAIQYGALEALQYLCENVPIDYRARNIRGENAIDIAAAAGKEDVFRFVVSFLLKKGEYDMVLAHLLGASRSEQSVKWLLSSEMDYEMLAERFAKRFKDAEFRVLLGVLAEAPPEQATAFVRKLYASADQDQVLLGVINASSQQLLTELIKIDSLRINAYLKENTLTVLSRLSPEVFRHGPTFNTLLDHFDLPAALAFRNAQKQHIFVILIESGNNTNSVYHLAHLLESSGLLKTFDLGAFLDEKDAYSLTLYDHGLRMKNVLPFTYLNQLAGRQEKFKFSTVKIKLEEQRQVTEEELKALRSPRPSTVTPDQVALLLKRPEFALFSQIFSPDNSHMTFNIDYQSFGIEVLYINTAAGLTDCLADLLSQEIISLDMETANTVTKVEVFSLIQISTLNRIYVIDAVELFEELRKSLKTVFENPKILKLIFSCMSDIKILYFYLQTRLVNFLDVCVAYNCYRNVKQGNGLKSVAADVRLSVVVVPDRQKFAVLRLAHQTGAAGDAELCVL